MSVANAETEEQAVEIFEAICFDDAFENLTAAVVQDAYLDSTGDYPTNTDLSYIMVDCVLEGTANSTEVVDGTSFSGISVTCDVELLAQEATRDVNGGRLELGEVESKLTDYIEAESVEQSDTFIETLVNLTLANSDPTCAENLNSPVEDIVDRRRSLKDATPPALGVLDRLHLADRPQSGRSLQGSSIIDSLDDTTVDDITVTAPTFAPSATPSEAPTAAPSIAPTEAPTEEQVCTDDEQCPEGQECIFSRRRRSLAFGYMTGVCAPVA